MDIKNLPDAQFKTLVMRMLKEITGYCYSIKKTQAEMKVTLSEKKKKNLQGIKSGGDETENQINDLEHKEEKSIQSDSMKKKELKKRKK